MVRFGTVHLMTWIYPFEKDEHHLLPCVCHQSLRYSCTLDPSLTILRQDEAFLSTYARTA